MVAALLPLRVRGACVRIRGVDIIGPVDLDLDGTGLTVVMGPNGAGKTTLLRMLHGLARLSKGEINWGMPIEHAVPRQAFVFQTPVVLRRNVLDNIAFPLFLRGDNRRRARELAAEWAARVGIADLAGRQAVVLSTGEKQKLALARALIREPDILFLDEPTANLDGRSMREIEAILMAASAAGTRIMMATHNIGQAKRLADEVVFLYRGHVHERADVERFFNHPQSDEATAFINGDIVE